MHNISYDYAKTVINQREAGLRKAQLDGTAYEYRPRRRWTFGWWKQPETRTTRPGGIAQASQ